MPTTSPPPRALFWAALLTIYIVWGSTYLAIRVMVETVPPLLGAGLRFLIAGAIFLLVLVVREGPRGLRVPRRQVAAAALAGTLLLFGGNGLVTIAEQAVPSGLTALIIAAVPLWVVVLRLLGRERVEPLTLVGVLAGFAGVGVLVLPGERPADAALWGVLLVVVASLAWATGSYVSGRLPLPGNAVLATALEMVLAGALMLVLALLRGEAARLDLGAISTASAVAFAYLVVAGSLLAFTAYVWLLANAPVSTVATYAYVNPVVALLLGALLLDEEITRSMVAGAVVIVVSVAFVVTRGAGARPRAGTASLGAGGPEAAADAR